MRFRLFCFFLFVSSQFFCFESFADVSKDKTKELTGLQSKIKQISIKLNNLKAKKNALVAELKKLDVQYGKSTYLLKELKDQIVSSKVELKKYQQKIGEKQHQINTQKLTLARQINVAYGMGKHDKLKLLLNQKDPSISERMMIYYDYLNKVRLEKIAKIDFDLQQLQALEEQRLNESKLLTEKLNEKKREQSLLIKTRVDRKKLLKKIAQKFISKKQQLHQFKASEKRLKTLISTIQRTMDDFPLQEGIVKEFSKLKGQLPWPVKGKIIKKFGAKRSDSQWDGVLIKAKNGISISVVARGRVVYADWLRGYGLLTIIEHGKGYMTLYAFNESLYKSVGEWVEAGAIIATAGQSGGQSESGLYFGIRKKGKPVNPEKWCRKIR